MVSLLFVDGTAGLDYLRAADSRLRASSGDRTTTSLSPWNRLISPVVRSLTWATSGSVMAPLSSAASLTLVSTAGASDAVLATSPDNPGTLPATATAAAVNAPRCKKLRRLRLPRQLSDWSASSIGESPMAKPPLCSVFSPELPEAWMPMFRKSTELLFFPRENRSIRRERAPRVHQGTVTGRVVRGRPAEGL